MGKKAARNSLRPDTAASLARGEMVLGLGRWSEALRCARSILARDRHHVGALELLAKALWQQGQYARLLIVMRRLVRINPYEPGYFALQGAAYQALGRYGDAVKAYGRSLEADPSESNLMVRRTLVELERWQTALVSDLLREDLLFRAQYAQDPIKACRERGFQFLPDREQELWLIEKREESALFPRPS